MPADSPSPEPSPEDSAPRTSRRARRTAERAAQLEAELAGHQDAASAEQPEAGRQDAGPAGQQNAGPAGQQNAGRQDAALAGHQDAAPAGQPDAVTTGHLPMGHAELPASPVEKPEPRELLAEPEPPSRAGRNLPVAIGVGVGLGAVLLASLLIRKEVFLGLAILACIGALWELDRALRTRDVRLPMLPLAVGTVGMLVSAYTAGIEALLVAFVLTAGGVFVWRVVDGGGVVALREATTGIFAAAYIPFLAGFLTIMLSADDGELRVLMLIALVVANDTGGYTAGVLFGRHPMAPTVSPKKSWEGAIGSLVLAIAVGVGFALWGLDLPWWAGALLGVAAVVGAVIGDLAESLLKRDLGIKDMGTVLPGHGGILDRVDSILLASPVVFALMLVLAPT